MSVHMTEKRLGIQKVLAPKLMHFVGIGGIGMSGLAEIYHSLGYALQGSDRCPNAMTIRLEKLGIRVFVGHCAQNLDNVSLIVRSSAISDENVEILEARRRGLPVLERCELLAELMRLKMSIAISGSHGKSTTTAMISSMCEAASLDPTVINGGIITASDKHAYIGTSDLLIAEADESDGTFVKVPSTVAVVTNVDMDHASYYGGYSQLKEAFRKFLTSLPFYGYGIVCADHAEARSIASSVVTRRMITYGIHHPSAHVQGANIRHKGLGSEFDVVVRHEDCVRNLANVRLNVPGLHNVQNCLAAVALGHIFKLSDEQIRCGIESFAGVERRFSVLGSFGGALIVDDYAHNPEKIAAALATAKLVAKDRNGRVIAIVQPHRYSRMRELFELFARSFADADAVYVADVYSAGEQPINGADSASLIAYVKANRLHDVIEHLSQPEQVPSLLRRIAQSNDVVIFIGAGSVTQWARNLELDAQS